MKVGNSHKRCRVCERNTATHMCEDCGEVFCLDCLESKATEYYVCSECHHTLGSPEPDESFEECPECESEELSIGKRIEEICPRCHSSKVVSIDDKRRDLGKKLRDSVMKLQYGHVKLREFNSKLTASKRLLVSLRMANFLHYHWIEDNIEGIQDEASAVKKRVVNQADMVGRQMAAETKGIIDPNGWSPDQFPFIEGVANRIGELGDHFKSVVDEALDDCLTKLDDITTQLEGLDYYRKEFASFYKHAELSVNELPVCALSEIRVTGSDFLKHDKATGTLYITNKRIVFIAEVGTFRKNMEIIFDFPLIYLNSIEEDGRIRKRLVLKMKQGDLKLSCDEQTEEVLPDYLEIAKKFDRYMQTDMQRVRRIEQSTLNISDVRLKIEELVYSLLSPSNRGGTGSHSMNERYHTGYGWQERPAAGYGRPNVPTPQHFTDHLEDILNRASLGQANGYRENNPQIQRLKRDARDLQQAVSRTVDLFRNRRLVPEDFVRRYRSLMLDSYRTRKEIDDVIRRRSDPHW
ncbi:hypothetical protein EU546_07425 [Candidatus Thorarchaeota archaeon]|nr:MAG: hypothetical protein EU546_07425 [Candidatus Thorarchaeota archaeon]